MEILNHRRASIHDLRMRVALQERMGGISVQTETISRAHWYRGQAADCLALIGQAPTDPVKAMLADMAARWLRLAELLHKREGGDRGGRPPETAAG
jgi:hypothetical protein